MLLLTTRRDNAVQYSEIAGLFIQAENSFSFVTGQNPVTKFHLSPVKYFPYISAFRQEPACVNCAADSVSETDICCCCALPPAARFFVLATI